MDQEKVTEFIKENKHQLRQLTSLNNEARELKGRVEKLEENNKSYPNEAELTRMNLTEGND